METVADQLLETMAILGGAAFIGLFIFALGVLIQISLNHHNRRR